MKQFNLKEYLENPNRKVVTRDGRSVRIICTDRKGEYPVVGLVMNVKGNKEGVWTFSKQGYFLVDRVDEFDLFFAPVPQKGWMNVFKFREATSVAAGGVIYESEQAARKAIENNQNYITTIKVEWEEE